MKSKVKFINGLRLCEKFYKETVVPILDKHWPSLKHSAGLIGSGSEVLGFDTPMSADHHWGPRVLLFLSAHDRKKYAKTISEVLSKELPYKFRGYSTNFSIPDVNDKGVQHLQEIDIGQVNHRVEIHTIGEFVKASLGLDPYGKIEVADWLTFDEQHLLELTEGKVYFDGLKKLNKIRRKFIYYPKDVWLYKLAAQWTRIEQEEPFMGRCGDMGDELGSNIIAARLVRDIMKLCFLMEKKYAPYSKWFGVAFAKLSCAEKLTPILNAVMSSSNWREREKHLAKAYSIVAQMHNTLGITMPLATKVSPFWSRPFMVIHGDHFSNAIRKSIRSQEVRNISANIGSVNQFIDCTDLEENVGLCKKLKVLFK